MNFIPFYSQNCATCQNCLDFDIMYWNLPKFIAELLIIIVLKNVKIAGKLTEYNTCKANFHFGLASTVEQTIYRPL